MIVALDPRREGERVPVTVIVEPDPDGHRFQAVSFVVDELRAAGAGPDDVVLLTSVGAHAGEQFTAHLGSRQLRVLEVFDGIAPATRSLAREIAAIARAEDVGRVVVMEADRALKQWWLRAPRAFAGLGRRRPRITFMLVRYPAAVRPTDLAGWRMRVSKGALVAAAMSLRVVQRAACFAGRDDTSRGTLVRRARDPAVCTAHSRDRAALRAEFGLPAERRLVGVYGVITANKNVPLIAAALQDAGLDADLLLAGRVTDEVQPWLDALPAAQRDRIHLIGGYLSNEDLDKLVACADVVPVPLLNPNPSGIMGKALASGVPYVTAGSVVRAREARLTGGGEVAELTAQSLGAGIARALASGPHRRDDAPDVTPRAFALALLGPPPRRDRRLR